MTDIPQAAINAAAEAVTGFVRAHGYGARGGLASQAQDLAEGVLAAAYPVIAAQVRAEVLAEVADVALPRDRASRRPMTFDEIQTWLRNLATEPTP